MTYIKNIKKLTHKITRRFVDKLGGTDWNTGELDKLGKMAPNKAQDISHAFETFFS